MTDSGFENASIWGEWHFVVALLFYIKGWGGLFFLVI